MIGRLDVTETGPIEAPLPDLEPGRRGVTDSWGLSLEAEKARVLAAMRDRQYWPRLARTTKLAVVMRPRHGSRRGFARWMATNLPTFGFDARRNYWTAPLAELEAAYKALSPKVVLSDGARVEVGQ